MKPYGSYTFSGIRALCALDNNYSIVDISLTKFNTIKAVLENQASPNPLVHSFHRKHLRESPAPVYPTLFARKPFVRKPIVRMDTVQ